MEDNLYHLVVREMERYTGKSLAGKNRVLIKCPWHADGTPSMAVTLQVGRGTPGQYSCFACGANSKLHGGWNGLAERLNLAKTSSEGYLTEWTGGAPIDTARFMDGERDWESMLQGWSVSRDEPIPKGYTWRGIEYPLLAKLRARYAIDDWGIGCTLFPAYVNGELVGGIKAVNRPRATTKRKYVNASGEWSRSVGLFPLHYKRVWPTVVLVEGPRDALTLLQQGIPALATLGTLSWSEAKRDLLLASGVKRVLVAADGDAAGEQAATLLMKSLHGYVPRRRVTMPADEDPASVPKSFWKPYRHLWSKP